MAGEEQLEPCSYDSTRRIFKVVWVIGNLFGLSVFALLLSWILAYDTGFSWSAPSSLFNCHAILMTFFVIFVGGNGKVRRKLENLMSAKCISAMVRFSNYRNRLTMSRLD